MAKKKETKPAFDPALENIMEKSASTVLTENIMPYSMSVIMSRAIPEIDGLKPSQRKVLYTMYKMGLLNGLRAKSAKISGQVLVLNPHSDSSAYETMVRMTVDNEALLTPLVDSKGNFGKHYSNATTFAASRYTEAKLAPVAAELFRGIDKGAVDFVDNFDSTTKEPTLLPETFPLILANAQEGIAVGIATKIPSFNLKELCAATVARIENPEVDLKEIMPAPDFPSGGILLKEDEVIDRMYESGKGSLRLSSRYRVDKKNNVVEIYEIPYNATDTMIIDDIHGLMEKGTVKEISGLVRNETDRRGLKIAFDYKRGTDPDALMKKLLAKTRLQTTYSCNFNILLDGRPQELGVYAILDAWIAWRRDCIRKILSHDLEQKKKELHRMEGLQKILLDLDKAIELVRTTEKDEEVVPALMNEFGIDEEQGEYVANIKLRNMNRKWIAARIKDVKQTEAAIRKLERQIRSKKEVDKLMVADLNSVSELYGKPRCTEIVNFDQDRHSYTETEPDYPVRYYRSREGYIKKVPASLVRPDTLIRSKDSDEIVQSLEATNQQEVLFFTRSGDVFKLYGKDLEDSRPADVGHYYRNLFDLNPDEEILFMTAMNEDSSLVLAFENGKAVRLPLSLYLTKTKRRKLTSAFSTAAPVAGMLCVRSGDERVALQSDEQKTLIVKAGVIPEKTSRISKGVQVMRLNEGAKTVRMLEADALGISETSSRRLRSENIPATGAKIAPARKKERSKSDTGGKQTV